MPSDLRPLRFDVALAVLAERAVSPKISTPVLRWRKTVRLFGPPEGARCSRKSFQSIASALADYANRNGASCWPSVQTLAIDSGYSERQVQYVLQALEDRGLLVRTGNGGRGNRRRYELVCRSVDKPVHDGQLRIETVQAATAKGCDGSHPRSVSEDRQLKPAFATA